MFTVHTRTRCGRGDLPLGVSSPTPVLGPHHSTVENKLCPLSGDGQWQGEQERRALSCSLQAVYFKVCGCSCADESIEFFPERKPWV